MIVDKTLLHLQTLLPPPCFLLFGSDAVNELETCANCSTLLRAGKMCRGLENAWHIDAVCELAVNKLPSCQSGTLMFVVGNGIDPSHPEFVDGQVLELARDGTLTAAPKVIPNERYRDDEHGENFHHETSIASLIAGKTIGIAPGHSLISVWVERHADGNYYNDSLREALESIYKHLSNRVTERFGSQAVINLSYSGRVVEGELDLFDRIQHHPVLIIGSAGVDEEPTRIGFPGCHGSIIVVGSIDHDKREVYNSSPSHRVSVYSPGTDICSACSRSGSYCLGGGTSKSAAIVSGLALRTVKQINDQLGIRNDNDASVGLQFAAMNLARARLIRDAEAAYVSLCADEDRDNCVGCCGKRHIMERAAPMARLTGEALVRQVKLNQREAEAELEGNDKMEDEVAEVG